VREIATDVMATSTTKLTLFHSIPLNSFGWLVRSSFIKNAPRFARRSYALPQTTHPFNCLSCSHSQTLQTVEALKKNDLYLTSNKVTRDEGLGLFTHPVTEDMAPTYLDVVSDPMDLETMRLRCTTSKSDPNSNPPPPPGWVRENFEVSFIPSPLSLLYMATFTTELTYSTILARFARRSSWSSTA